MDWIGIFSGVLAIVGTLLKIWMDNRPERLKEAADEATQRGRSDIQSGNVDAVERRIDSLLADQAGPGDSPAGEPSAEDVERRLREL